MNEEPKLILQYIPNPSKNIINYTNLQKNYPCQHIPNPIKKIKNKKIIS